MTLIERRKVIAHIKRTQNLFIFDLKQLKKAMATMMMTIQSKAMATIRQDWAIAITGQDQPIYLVSQNKYIQFWHWQLVHISHGYIVRAAKLVNNINLEQDHKKYIFTEVFINSNNLDMSLSNYLDKEKLFVQLLAETSTEIISQISLHQTRIDNLNIIN